MNVFDTVRVVVYRFHEKGLEIFLVNTGLEEESWRIPFSDIAKYPVNDLEVGDRPASEHIRCLDGVDDPGPRPTLEDCTWAIRGDELRTTDRLCHVSP